MRKPSTPRAATKPGDPRVCFVYANDPAVAGGGSDARVQHLFEGVATRLPAELIEVGHSNAGIPANPTHFGRLHAALEGVPPRISQRIDFKARVRLLEELAAFDLIVANTAFTLPLLDKQIWRRVILDAHNVETNVVRQLAESDPSRLRRLAYGATGPWTRRWEQRTARRIAAVWAVSEKEADWFRQAGAPRVDVIENGVIGSGEEIQTLTKSPVILFVGSLGSGFNRDGLAWFIEQCLPRIRATVPSATLHVVGAGSEQFAAQGVQPLGYVERLEDAYGAARVAVVPIISGAGTRLKAVEALGHGIPVVGTNRGLEGLDLTHRKTALIADEPARFADYCIEVMTNDQIASIMRAEGLALAAGRFHWPAISERAAQSLREVFLCA